MQTYYDVIVIGGGAAGCMAAGFAAQNGNKVLLCERNEKIGIKISMQSHTGKLLKCHSLY